MPWPAALGRMTWEGVRPASISEELPLYKIVLASPSDFDEEYIDAAWLALELCVAFSNYFRARL